ncbi:MAG: hypothetical protein PQJ44_02755 [Sphaerochaetaceae bacterium]|nr:hypothetical protein [Sphaerochaetaceae bacterium]
MYYHGSKTSGIKELQPNFSMHGEKYVYLTTNRAVALVYTVNAIERFYEDNKLEKPEEFQPWYSYGFDKEKLPVFDEYYPNAVKETYKGKSGFIYICEEPKDFSNPTNIYCAIVTKSSVKTIKEEYIEDVYEEILKLEKQGLCKIRRFEEAKEKYLNKIESYIKEDIEKYNLNEDVNHNYGVFLRAKFPHLF